MDEINVYFLDDSELAEYEAICKGYRIDVYVSISDHFYNIRAYTMVRLQQDFESENESYGYYAVEPNLVIVRDTNTKEIACTIKKLYEQKYFDEIRPIDKIDINNLKKIM